ncbi:MAG: TIGR03915 family putative DNA repair protein [Lachnospiraceae bacterium]|nr:TIGR03915 family putative DNA repair protein [Lachnospiraceae bacterium]
MIIYRCEDSLEGIMTGIYRVYEDKTPVENAALSLDEEQMLFSEERYVEPDAGRARKTASYLQQKFGEDDYATICHALASDRKDKAQAVFRTVASGIEKKTDPGRLFDNLADEYVNAAFRLARATIRELDHLLGFTRFRELNNGILYAQIEPSADLLVPLMEHFCGRLGPERFLIYDIKRKKAGIHIGGSDWYLRQGEIFSVEPSAEEYEYSELFRCFCRKISIEERKNLNLQRSMLPLHFRTFMTEFAKNGQFSR